jgi:hypothetical protein
LKEIRDDELYKEDGFDTWDAYLKQRVSLDFGIEGSYAVRLINAAIVRPKLPDPKILPDNCPGDEKPSWKPSVVREFERLAPQDPDHAQRRDLRRLKKTDVEKVAKAAVEIAKEQGKPVTANIVRQAVNAELGIKPEKREPAPKQDYGIDLPVYLKQKIGQIEGIIELLADVPADGWKLLEKSEPRLAERLATVCDELAGLLRS